MQAGAEDLHVRDITMTSVSPGWAGIFDPFGFSKGDLKEAQTKEIKNGRCATCTISRAQLVCVCSRGIGGVPAGRWRVMILSAAALCPINSYCSQCLKQT